MFYLGPHAERLILATDVSSSQVSGGSSVTSSLPHATLTSSFPHSSLYRPISSSIATTSTAVTEGPLNLSKPKTTQPQFAPFFHPTPDGHTLLPSSESKTDFFHNTSWYQAPSVDVKRDAPATTSSLESLKVKEEPRNEDERLGRSSGGVCALKRPLTSSEALHARVRKRSQLSPIQQQQEKSESVLKEQLRYTQNAQRENEEKYRIYREQPPMHRSSHGNCGIGGSFSSSSQVGAVSTAGGLLLPSPSSHRVSVEFLSLGTI